MGRYMHHVNTDEADRPERALRVPWLLALPLVAAAAALLAYVGAKGWLGD